MTSIVQDLWQAPRDWTACLNCSHIGLISVGILLSVAITRRYLTPLRTYPGPPLASITRLWKIIDVATARTNVNSIELHRKYGPFVRIAPNEISVSSPQAAAEILAPGKGFTKTDFYSVFPPQEPKDIFTETNEHVHAKKKRVAAVPYSLSKIVANSDAFTSTMKVLISKFHDLSQSQGVIDLGEWLHYFAFDSLGEAVFSTNFGFLEAGRDIDDTLNTIKRAARYGSIVGQVPFLDRFLFSNWIMRALPFKRKDLLVASRALAEVQQRKPFNQDKGNGRKDVLDHLVAGHLNSAASFTEDDVSAIAIGAIFAGSDSTASTMQSFFHLVLQHRRVYDRIVDELQYHQISGNLTSDLITYAEAQQLRYFQAALTETMRLRPAVGVNISREAPRDGVTIQGRQFSEHTRFAVNAWAVHRDYEVFGEDAGPFRPERWLEGDHERIRLMRKHLYQVCYSTITEHFPSNLAYLFLQFGAGSHVCLGRNLALLEMNRLLPQLLREFEMELVDPTRELKAEAVFFVIQSGLEVRINQRANQSIPRKTIGR
ncbi:hypothetical protein LTR84_006870 [Exophiala bonariae]|uniref:Cytochrome P450 n=1 Tax=Exophiala bonariae TaxID=1690606 RepID=A0AAV9N0G6_9EURO|nr:hypothetical protein LTR84_006870 [Exophiala bonariae]